MTVNKLTEITGPRFCGLRGYEELRQKSQKIRVSEDHYDKWPSES